MTKKEITQIKQIIENFLENKKYVPYLGDLEQHKIYGGIFTNLGIEQKKTIKDIINAYIEEIIFGYKTKGGQLFRRYFENNTDDFRKFRDSNCDSNLVQTKEFQTLGKEIEQEMFKLEGILTEKMLDQEKGLDKVLGSFYNIIYSFFPRFNEIE